MKKGQEVLERDISLLNRQQLLPAIFSIAQKEGYPIAFYRSPLSNEFNLILSFKPTLTLKKFELQELKEGFAFAPYNYGQENGHFIEADLRISFDFNETLVNWDESNSELTNKIETLSHEIYEELGEIFEKPLSHERLSEQYESDYIKLVENCKEAINDGFFEKVVPARFKDIELGDSFNLISLLDDLTDAYPNAFVSFVSIPEVGSWIGATPELLIEREKNIFRTVALAATQRFDPDLDITDTAWNQKEIEEQTMVSRYIINCFKKIRLRDFHEKGPETIKAGNLLHLKTSFEVDMEATKFPELASVMLDLLHPTSAVAGMPKDPAREFLKIEENLNRSFYSGFLGPVNLDDRSSLYVNLRCMEINAEKARLYAGAGVTAHSNPQKEFDETEMKFNTLLNILNQAQ